MATFRRTAACITTFLVLGGVRAYAQTPAVAVDNDDIGGVVVGPAGPEAGVWVIAETEDFATRYAKIVVTDDAGRFVVPDLPPADYRVWVRGYGLVDSGRTAARPGSTLTLTGHAAPSPGAAAIVYPAIYWYSMMKVPPASEVSALPGGVNQYLASIKNLSCIGCHQIGQLATRSLPPAFESLPSHHEAWVRRIQSGQAGQQMLASAMNQLGGVPPKYLADWTERVAGGELPHATPTRPRGVERNIVATVRDWSTDKAYMHDLSGTDRRKPTVNGYGKLYGAAELSTDELPILDPKTNTATVLHAPVRDADTPTTNSTPRCSPPPTGAAKRSGTAKRTSTTRCSMKRAVSGTRPWCARPTTRRRSAKPARIIRRRSCSRCRGRAGNCPCTTRKPRSTRSSTRAIRRTTCNLPRTPITRSGPAAAAPSWAG
jgi:hypothetical protein